jgi:polyhydroxyalkanoate synthesis repressor PhaR
MAMNAETPVQVRRYPNRRLYDRSRRRYVTLQDVEELVQSGRIVEVRDSKTGEDLTRQVLTQILMERHPAKMEMFPVAMLHSILRANGMAIELWRGYLRQALAAMEVWQKATTPFGLPMDWMTSFLPVSGLTPAAPAAPEGEPAREALARRLEELAGRIERLETGGPASGAHPRGSGLDDLEARVRALEPDAAPPRTRRKAGRGA